MLSYACGRAFCKTTLVLSHVILISVIRGGSYDLFETDSEEEEEQGCSEKSKDELPERKTALQVWPFFWVRVRRAK